jgi:predicted DsbA family dithiol-disulfide isomerase
MGRQNVAVSWKPFQLNPAAPKEGMDRQAYRIRKFGSLEYSRQLEARVAAAGAEEGIAFRFDAITKTPNTFDAHRLIWLAGQDGGCLQDTIVEALFHAYFLDAQDVGDRETLKRIGVTSGLDAARIEELFSGLLGISEVTAEERAARERGVDGVPSFFVNGSPAASGAQKAELLAAALTPFLS